MGKIGYYLIIIFGIAGIFDAGFLTYEHFQGIVPPCTANAWFADCGKVLNSSYSVVLGIPLALIGFFYYFILTALTVAVLFGRKKLFAFGILIFTSAGLLGSIYFVYLQLVVIQAVCFYCMVSALNSLILFLLAQNIFSAEQKFLIVKAISFGYRTVMKKVFFAFDPETIHVSMTSLGEEVGKSILIKKILSLVMSYKNPALVQTVAGMKFQNPIGLSAGFDYEAQLTQVLPFIGFGFETVGTITNHAYAGNARPMLGRLPKSKSLMVNKGFKNEGADETIRRLDDLEFQFPLGVSIGRTNRAGMTQEESVEDILSAFKKFEKSKCLHSYYELNISCPNLLGKVTFYNPQKLDYLLAAVDSLEIKRPIFIKMPIEKTDAEVLGMLKVISKHKITGVIFGNLQKDRKDPALEAEEVSHFAVGYFSGKPTYKRSNELISLAYKNYGKQFVIIGCGGVFSAEDAYTKICLGATLVQLITGMIYNGPQLIAEINLGLTELMRKDGFSFISEAVGSRNDCIR